MKKGPHLQTLQISLYPLPPSAVRFPQAGLKYFVDVPLNVIVIMAFRSNLTSSFNTWIFDWPQISEPYEKFEAKSAYYIGNQWFCKVFYLSLGKSSFAPQNFFFKIFMLWANTGKFHSAKHSWVLWSLHPNSKFLKYI